MGMISKASIDTVFETARVEEVIGDFVQLKRAGSNFKGLSPFTDERSPSFMVSPVKQIWKDFSSGKGGNVVAFLMEHEHFTYPEAIRWLAKKYNIELEETEVTDQEKQVQDEKESLYLVSEFAQKYFHTTLLNSDEGQAIGLSYFKERGFTLETIKKFGLGYSPETWDALSKEALGKGYKQEFLVKSGLTIAREDGRLADRFRGRVMFPIQSLSGRVLGFGGRILSNDKKVAKYLNSPESDIYHKSKVLYGIYHAKQAIAKLDNCYLVEGYTDVIQFHQAGIENVVASSGTALTPDQIRLIHRLTKNVTVLFDGDAAGLRASIRGIDLILEQGMNVRVCTFPDGEDPDSFARKNPTEVLVKYLEDNATDFISFKASLLMKEAKQDPIKKAELIRDMVVSISKIPDRIQREIYIQECSRIMDISEQVLVNSLAQQFNTEIGKANKEFTQKAKEQSFQVVKHEQTPQMSSKAVLDAIERQLLTILMLYGNRVEEFTDTFMRINADGDMEQIKETKELPVYERLYLCLQEDEVEFTNPLFKSLYENLMGFFQSGKDYAIDKLLAHLNPEEQEIATDILMQEEKETLHNWESKNIVVKLKDQSVSQLLTQSVLTLRMKLIHDLVQNKMGEIEGFSASPELLEDIVLYNQLRIKISDELGAVIKRFA